MNLVEKCCKNTGAAMRTLLRSAAINLNRDQSSLVFLTPCSGV